MQSPFESEFGLKDGYASRISERAPVTKTVESEVPLLEFLRSPEPVLIIFSPGAITSGFRGGL